MLNESTTGTSVRELHWVNLGGVPQAVYAFGARRDLPIALFIHGGPGVPYMPFAHVNADLGRSYLIIHWDQRGSGKSYSPRLRAEEITIGQLVEDAHELVEWLCSTFRQDTVIVAGHSWGSVLAAMLVQAYPERVRAYVAIGQVTNLRLAEMHRYQCAVRVADQQHDERMALRLQKLGPPPYDSQQQSDRLESIACKLTRDCHRPLADLGFFRRALTSPEYSWIDLVKIPLGARLSQRCLWQKLFHNVDLFRQVSSIAVPVFAIMGTRDLVAGYPLAKRFFATLQAPYGKTFVEVLDAGHWLHLEHPGEFQEFFRNIAGRCLT